MKRVLFLLLQDYADWEAAPLAAAVNSTKGWQVRTVSLTREPVRSIGGFTLLPDWDLSQAMGQEFAGLVLIGGKSWRTKEAEQVEPLVRRAWEKGAVLAGICDASVYLGTLGMLNDADHTSNQMADLQNYAGDRYTGALRYQNRQAVRDGKLVTANGTAHMEFAREVLLALDVMPPDAVEQWYRFYKMGYYLAMGL